MIHATEKGKVDLESIPNFKSSLLSGSFLINFSFLSLTKIDLPFFFFSSDPAVSSSFFVGESEENLNKY